MHTRGREENLKCLDEHVSQVKFEFGTTAGAHGIVRGTAVRGVPWAGQHGGCHTQRSSNFHVFGGSSEETASSVNEGRKRGPHSCNTELPAVPNSLANSSRSPGVREIFRALRALDTTRCSEMSDDEHPGRSCAKNRCC